MDCRTIQDRLYEAEGPDEDPIVANHLRGCADCRALADRLVRLEELYRAEAARPAPGVDFAMEGFLKKHPAPESQPQPPRRSPTPFSRWRWVAMAAILLLCFGVGMWAPWPGQQVQAADDLVDRLVDWNLELSEIPILDDRVRLHDQREAAFRSESAGLDDDDRELADALFANAAWLARNDDPVDRAERFDKLANRLLKRLRKDADRRDAKVMKRLAKHYGRVQELGKVKPKASANSGLSAAEKKKNRRRNAESSVD